MVSGISHEPSVCSRDDPSFGFWLRACKNFRVLSPYGRLGRVRGHRYNLEGDLRALIVETGVFRRRTLEIDPEEISWILPLGRRILLDDWASI